VNNDTYKLGQVPYNLLASTDGKWKLTPDKPLANGTYDVVATVTDGAAASVSDATQGELVINVPEVKPAEPAPASVAAPVAEPYDCEAVLGKISKVFPIRFEFARTKLVAPYDLTVNQYTSLLKDPRCATMKVEIEGHADYIGPVSFNQFLSDLRAEKLRTVLVDAGIDPARLSTKGFSEMAPLDPQKTVEARAKNRRVEFHSVK
jgi:outer membrane protein OmpA-like peptidoglycan-associated protein